jgi:CheY-like chemotaxis protein
MNVIVVEDDYMQFDWINMNLKEAFGAEPRRFKTEREFHDAIGEIKENPPDVIVMDVMLPWDALWKEDQEDEVKPDEVRQEGEYRAGFRCQALLAQDEKTKMIPLILYTVQNREDLSGELKDLPPSAMFLSKGEDISPLIDKIAQLTGLKKLTGR